MCHKEGPKVGTGFIFTGVPVPDEVEQSFIYCMQHPMGPQDMVPPHESPLFSPALLSSWRSHYASK